MSVSIPVCAVGVRVPQIFENLPDLRNLPFLLGLSNFLTCIETGQFENQRMI